MVFESVKKERLAKAWNFFLFEKETENAKCLLCQQVLKLPKTGQNLEMTA